MIGLFQVVDIDDPEVSQQHLDLGPNDPLERDICILGAPSPLYGLYVTYRLILRHILPAILVFIAMVHPETNFSKRVSYLFFGHLSAPCACGEDGASLGLPHECPNMQTAMLKSAADGKICFKFILRFWAYGIKLCTAWNNFTPTS